MQARCPTVLAGESTFREKYRTLDRGPKTSIKHLRKIYDEFAP